ncbi:MULTISPECIES: acyl carrier protein [unclassified Solwaraspora]|uniref:acyl carrier protein n=1 Tax=unclassified Solwaraspora TaxID=2627926 RepID=UPI00248B2EC8|nr:MULTISPECIES: acyl carrier protein [unclassified Solwaraspora]WBC00003.1 acyl carrier protein [Solwaraspora sp. WMMA2059]WBC21451.1 acyl carrier protein [Solwaraspora sp. WMMA2080]WJK36469.1 acyl carrier protein [Solwaraspora sp. WMMA2065]
MPADHDTILTEISQMLRAVLPGIDPDEEITMDTSFRDDLEMESIDVISLAGRLQARYGDSVNFAQFVAGLDVDSLRALRVGELVEHISAALDGPPASVAQVAGQ